MKSVKKTGNSSIRAKNNNEDVPSIPEPKVEPCCRLPRENINESSSSSSIIQNSTTSLNPSKSLSTKFEEAEGKLKSEQNDGKLKMTKEKSKEKSKDKSIEIIENFVGGIADHSVLSKEQSMKIIDEITSSPSIPLNLEPMEKNVNVPIEDKPPVVPTRSKRIPIVEQSKSKPTNVAVPRLRTARPAPENLDERPLILATHVVPSLPIALFEILVEVIEASTGKAVVLLHEQRVDRPVAKDLVDIAILPASDNWKDGYLLPVSFVFEHPLNKEKNPAVYVDVVVAQDCMRNIEEVIDLRGYRCALPDRRKTVGSAGLLFNHLKSKGENPSFFGNTLDSGSQLAALQMVAGKQAEVGVVEGPVINCHRKTLPGMDSLYILESLGPLPPYRIMLNRNFDESLREKIKVGLLGVEGDEAWIERLRPFGVIGFAEYTEDQYDLQDVKIVVTSVPYY